MITKFFFILLLIGTANAQDLGGLRIAASGDLVGEFGLNSSSAASGRLLPREAEIALYSPADYLFEGTLSAAGHFENGATLFELHELIVETTKLIPRSKIRVGQFFLGVGRLNRFHRHDWPFISAPIVHRTFFAQEGVIDQGIEYEWLLPMSFYLDLTLGVTNGWVFGHSHVDGARPKIPTHYARAATFFSFGTTSGAELGLNYIGRRNNQGINMSLFGLDFTAKWRELRTIRWLIQSETWLRSLDGERVLGSYVFPRYAFDQNFSFGVRLDGMTNLDQQNALGASESNFSAGIVPTAIYQTSEFVTFKTAYRYETDRNEGQTTRTESLLEVQAIFILGAHKAHDF